MKQPARAQFVNELPYFEPPIIFSHLRHLFVRLSVKKIDKVILWCKKEYWDSVNYWSKRGNFKNVKFEVEEFSTVRLMASLVIFDDIVGFIKKFPFVWDGLSKSSRDFLTKSYNIRNMLNQ